MKVTQLLISSIKWLWQLPQNLLAISLESLLCQYANRGDVIDGNQIIYCKLLPASCSLGDYLFISKNSNSVTILHENGHSKQSTILGPMYLIVIGIPSLLHNIIYRICRKLDIKWNYYNFYTEKWANKLVGLHM